MNEEVDVNDFRKCIKQSSFVSSQIYKKNPIFKKSASGYLKLII